MVGRVIRRIMHRLIRGVFRARWIVVGLLGLLLVGGAAGMLQGGSLPSLNLAMPGFKRAPDSTENFLKAQQTYDADLMWNSLSDEAADRWRARGGSVQDTQRQMNQARDKGTKFDQINYVGGQPLPDGTSMQFYVVSARGFSARSDVEYVTYIFTLDRSGKILKVQ